MKHTLLYKFIERDLKELFETDVIQRPNELNNSLEKITDKFASKSLPMYFTGKYDAKTVFVMLNPGGSEHDCYSFEKNEKFKYNDLNQLIENYMHYHINYGDIDCDRMDNFDLKQAAFLFDFKNSGIEIPDFYIDEKLKHKAKQNVLMDKLQMELLPYKSREFTKIFDSPQLASKNIKYFTEDVERLLDVIIESERKYIIFAAKQFENLFRAYKTETKKEISFGDKQFVKLENLKMRVSCLSISIQHKGKSINALIACTFPRQDLPNAFDRMREYGRFCYDNYPNS